MVGGFSLDYAYIRILSYINFFYTIYACTIELKRIHFHYITSNKKKKKRKKKRKKKNGEKYERKWKMQVENEGSQVDLVWTTLFSHVIPPILFNHVDPILNINF